MMDYTDWQLGRFVEDADRAALVWRDGEHRYGELLPAWQDWLERLTVAGVAPGAVVAVAGDFSPTAVSVLLALVRLRCTMVPLWRGARELHDQLCEMAEVDYRIDIDESDQGRIAGTPPQGHHPLLQALRERGEAGLVLFTSGSTGRSKVVLHALPRLLERFRRPGHRYRAVTFLLFDHIGGLNTLFYTLANGGCLVVPEDRSVSEVCRAIERHCAQLLPTSPSFLNLLLLDGSHRRHDLSSLELVSYGAEVMPERTLARLHEALPGVRLQQTYGLSELGILRSKSASSESLLLRLGGDGYEMKVVDGTLRIRAKCSMLGYLNAPSPFDAEGWFDTGDSVTQEGEYYHIHGRISEVVNVGGQKVHPADVERVIAELPELADVSVSGEPHLLLGNVVVATVQMVDPLPAAEVKRRILEHCRGRLQPFMVPAKVNVVTESLLSYRFKKARR